MGSYAKIDSFRKQEREGRCHCELRGPVWVDGGVSSKGDGLTHWVPMCAQLLAGGKGFH